eukprot:231228_1
MIYLLYISWLFITQAAKDCYEGYFEKNNLDQCVFNCNYDGVEYIEKAKVTFDQITHGCYNVRRGYQLGYCSKLDDLVWSGDCKCPYCKCTDKDAVGTAKLFEALGR